MAINSWAGLIAVLLGILSFYVTVYAVIALNVGWRFGYWLSSAIFGALMVMMSIFWIVNPVGPRGEDPRWIPVAAERERIAQATFEDERFSAPAQYPGGPWSGPEESGQADQREGVSSAVQSCVTTNPEHLPEAERAPCAAAQDLMPAREDIPVIEGTAVSVTPEVTEMRFATEQDALLAQVTVLPITNDPRVADDPEAGEAMGEPFLLVAILDEGSVRLPAYGSLAIFALYAGFHLWGLHRAEQRKLSPILA